MENISILERDNQTLLDNNTLDSITKIWINSFIEYKKWNNITNEKEIILHCMWKIKSHCIRYWYPIEEYINYRNSNNIHFWKLANKKLSWLVQGASTIINQKIYLLLICEDYYPDKFFKLQDELVRLKEVKNEKLNRENIKNQLINDLRRNIETWVSWTIIKSNSDEKSDSKNSKTNKKKTSTFFVDYDHLIWVDSIYDIDPNSEEWKALNLIVNKITTEKPILKENKDYVQYLSNLDHKWKVPIVAVDFVKQKLLSQ